MFNSTRYKGVSDTPQNRKYFDQNVDQVTATAVGLLVAQLDGTLPMAGRDPERIAPTLHRGRTVMTPAGDGGG